MKTNARTRRPAATRLLTALLLASGGADAGTVLEYAHDGECATDFERMSISGLHARIDMRVEDLSMSILFDDGEQLMYQLLHDMRTYMTMESDDDAVDFTSDVGRSVSLHAEKQTKALTGMDNAQGIAAFRDAQVAACPDMAGRGFADPDYAEAAQRCAQKMANAAGADGQDRRKFVEERSRRRDSRPISSAAKGAAAPVKWSTTTTERADAPEMIDGRACTRERIVRGDVVLREDCMAALDSLGLDARAQRRLQRIVKVGHGMSEGIASLHPELDADRAKPAMLSLERTCHRDGAASGHARLRIRGDATIDAGTFELPAGYAPMQMPQAAPATASDALRQLQQAGSLQH